LQKKKREIEEENRKLLKRVDEIIEEGQKMGVIDNTLKPGVIRQILGGSTQLLTYGLFLQNHLDERVGYEEADAYKGLLILIEKFRKPASQ